MFDFVKYDSWGPFFQVVKIFPTSFTLVGSLKNPNTYPLNRMKEFHVIRCKLTFWPPLATLCRILLPMIGATRCVKMWSSVRTETRNVLLCPPKKTKTSPLNICHYQQEAGIESPPIIMHFRSEVFMEPWEEPATKNITQNRGNPAEVIKNIGKNFIPVTQCLGSLI